MTFWMHQITRRWDGRIHPEIKLWMTSSRWECPLWTMMESPIILRSISKGRCCLSEKISLLKVVIRSRLIIWGAFYKKSSRRRSKRICIWTVWGTRFTITGRQGTRPSAESLIWLTRLSTSIDRFDTRSCEIEFNQENFKDLCITIMTKPIWDSTVHNIGTLSTDATNCFKIKTNLKKTHTRSSWKTLWKSSIILLRTRKRAQNPIKLIVGYMRTISCGILNRFRLMTISERYQSLSYLPIFKVMKWWLFLFLDIWLDHRYHPKSHLKSN